MRIFVTGSCGFIGFHLILNLLKKNKEVFGIDNLNNFTNLKLKNERLKILKKYKNFTFLKVDIKNQTKIIKIFKKHQFKYIIHFAAQTGVRYSVQNPKIYLDSNLVGFYNILDAARIFKIKHFIFASSSSVYGNSKKFPLKENYNTDKPLSFYAATKKSNEVMAHSYSNIFKLPCTGLRFFTVYGPYGRPDMSLMKFAHAIRNLKKIELYNKGNHIRDFTYIDDVIKAINKIIMKPSRKLIPFEIFNVGSNNTVKLKLFLELIEKKLNKKAKIRFKSLQKGDVYKTHASIKKLQEKIYYNPKTNIKEGINKFFNWFEKYYN